MSWIERDIDDERDALKNYDVFNILDFRDKEEVTLVLLPGSSPIINHGFH